MKKLYAQVSYTFSNFYNNLSSQGQIIFTIIVGLILILFIILLITTIIQKVKTKKSISKILNENIDISKKNEIREEHKIAIEKTEENKNEVKDIAKRIEDALENTSPVTLTSFEEDQERTAIISIDELMAKAKELEIIDDEVTGVNYLEKYNLEPSYVEDISKKVVNNDKKEVKAFKVSQVISPIYGIKKDVVDEDK